MFFFRKKKVLEGRHVLSRSLQQLAKQEGCLQRSWNRYKVQLTGNCQLDRIATRLLQCKCIRRHPLLKACEHRPDLSPPSSASPFSSPAQMAVALLLLYHRFWLAFLDVKSSYIVPTAAGNY